MYTNRRIKSELKNLLSMYPIVTLTGPRQSGKTTFLENEFPEYRYINLEDPELREYVERDPKGFLKEYDKYVILDEVQRIPILFSYIQVKVDKDKIMGQYIFSGSQNFQLMENIDQSLAGRVGLLQLFPFDIEEMKAAKWLQDDNFATYMQRGSYPGLYDRNIPSRIFYANYLQTYIERDVRDLQNIQDLKLFRSFITMCALRAGQIINLNNIATDLGISQPTAKAWLSVLETSYIVFSLQPYYVNMGKRIVKTSKLYFYDTGLLCHLLKIRDPKDISTSEYKGHLFENMVISEFVKNNAHQNLQQEFMFWRDAVGNEVDLLVQTDQKVNAIEIKATSTIKYDLFKGLNYFSTLYPDFIKSKNLVYTDTDTAKRNDINVLPWIDVCKNNF
jgi:uncharacterized protein